MNDIQLQKELEKFEEEQGILNEHVARINHLYTQREIKFIYEALRYSSGYAPGFPGHNLLIIVAKLAQENGYDLQILSSAITTNETTK